MFRQKIKKGVLPAWLQTLEFGKFYQHKIKKGVLPIGLKSITLSADYKHIHRIRATFSGEIRLHDQSADQLTNEPRIDKPDKTIQMLFAYKLATWKM
jgi:hypothetical protein